MQLTAQEMKLMERLRKRERQWPRMRWMLLGVAALTVGIYSFILYQIIQKLESGEDAMFMVAFFWPKCLLGFCLAGWLIGWAIRDWNGNAQRILLLRLLDAQQNKDAGDKAV
jgi:hypothetical protein